MLSEIWQVLREPEDGGDWYRWALIACGHALVGAALGTLAPWWAVGLLYLALKEIPDRVLRGGGWRDGCVDTGFVALGALYAGPAWWPWAIAGAVWAGDAWRVTRTD